MGKSETFGEKEDPDEDGGDIPFCTLKHFPEETIHCVEYARDKFERIFSQKPKLLVKLLSDKKIEITSGEELKTLREAVKFLKFRPTTFEDCISYARNRFQRYFHNDIK